MICHFLADAFREGDPRTIQAALGTVARARGIRLLASDTGIGPEALYRELYEDGNADFATIVKVVNALGLRDRRAGHEPLMVSSNG